MDAVAPVGVSRKIALALVSKISEPHELQGSTPARSFPILPTGQHRRNEVETDLRQFGTPQFAYVIVRVGVKDPKGIGTYLKQLRPILATFGGELILQGRPVESLLEGKDDGRMLAVLRFKDSEQAKTWFHSDEYKEAKALLLRSADVGMTLFEGIYGF
jgi:uncharacterized protein (DUF1330 family)